MFSRVEDLKIPDIEKTDCSMFAKHVISVVNVTYVRRSLWMDTSQVLHHSKSLGL